MTVPTDETHFTGHKFRTLNEHLWNNLEKGCVYFAAPSKLNDPFACQIDLMKAVKLAKAGAKELSEADLARWHAFTKTITEPAATCGVFSMCSGDIRGLEERLLWSHYASDHKGVCVTYQVPYSFVDTLIGVSAVKYGAEKLLDALRSLDLSTKPDFESRIKPVITSFLTTKAEQWSYEKEVRFISFEPGLVKFESDWLRQICFGLNTSPEDRAQVIGRVKQLGYTECRFAELVHLDSGLYELDSRQVQA